MHRCSKCVQGFSFLGWMLFLCGSAQAMTVAKLVRIRCWYNGSMTKNRIFLVEDPTGGGTCSRTVWSSTSGSSSTAFLGFLSLLYVALMEGLSFLSLPYDRPHLQSLPANQTTSSDTLSQLLLELMILNQA
ncbi:hypothetical protein BGX38DRAFT_585094 [Terfezia claveryi]|nr:hypothetical protein BGX38DRAFT_585094 [Terfezia claveryi]